MTRIFLLMLAAFALPYIVARILSAAGVIKKPLSAILGIVLGLGAAMVMLVVIVLVETDSSSRDGAYQPPRLEDGEIRPGQFEDRDPPPTEEPI
ncbi:hypothetical protein [Oceanicaulis sp. MMSF_3324]|uniref:hypothetical protein n=1 Tax=Oceanicaulis sp. MMSF_3324 TaxID=3046702 RepID=UPI00273FC71F|nr:hypothetical protein [Oceanicaulis sp. MMSF_3324]